jgi:hypothetical protein
LEERQLMDQLLQHNLNHAKQQMKLYVDKKRTDKTFQVGDQVFVKLQPYVQSLVAHRTNHKLAFRYFEPYQVSRSINTVAFEIALPYTSRIHPIFHVSQLCKALLPGTPTSSQLPTLTNKPVTPVKILATWWKRGPCGRTEKVQVQWSNPTVLDITLKIKSLQQHFLDAQAWGQASCNAPPFAKGITPVLMCYSLDQ